MHEHFADWHSRGSFAVTSEQLTARWGALQTILDKVANEIGSRLELVRMAHQEDVEVELGRSVASSLQAADALFPMESNSYLLALLASAALIDRFETKTGHVVTAAALAVRTATVLGWEPALSELPMRAGEYLEREGQRLRPTDAASGSDSAAAIKKAVGAVTAETAGGIVPAAQLGTALDAISTGAAGAQSVAQTTASAVTSLREQLNILWWLFGEHSYCADVDFSQIDPPSAPFVIAVDLTSLTEQVPGPIASRAFLLKGLKLAAAHEGEISAADSINATARTVREHLHVPSNERIRTFAPLAELTRRSMETTSKSDWVASGSSATGYAAKEKRIPLDLAQRAYEEQLLVRLAG